MTFTTTPGSRAPIMYESPSSIRLKPGDEVKVVARRPAAPAPYSMLMAATSLTACTNSPWRRGSRRAISSAPSVDGVIGYPKKWRQPARMAPIADAYIPLMTSGRLSGSGRCSSGLAAASAIAGAGASAAASSAGAGSGRRP